MLFWERLREEEFDDAIKASDGLCVVPIGCLEKHGQHQPTGTDLYIARTIVEEVARSEDFVIFPTPHWVGDVAPYHAAKDPSENRGGIGLDPLTLMALLEELCDEIARNGFTKICLFSAHGGNAWILPQFLRRQVEKKKQYATYYYTVDDNVDAVDPERLLNNLITRREEFPEITDEDIETVRGLLYTGWGFGGGHANFVENAQLMVRHKELIAPDKYDVLSGLSTHKFDYLFAKGVRSVRSSNYPNNYSGYAPHGSNERIGAAMIRLDAERAANAIRAIKQDKYGLEFAQLNK